MKKILIIDDDQYDRNLVRLALQKIHSDFVIHEACDGQEGCAIAQSIIPDVTFLDLRLPDMDGISTLKCIREHKSSQNCKVVVLTGSDDMKEFKLALYRGANDIYTKPINFSGYVSVTNKIINDFLMDE